MSNCRNLETAILKGQEIKVGDVIVINNYDPYKSGGMHGKTKIMKIEEHTNPKMAGMILLTDTRDITYTISQFENIDCRIEAFVTTLSPAEMGKRGGAVKSEAKKNASKENGKKGGRPKKII